MSIVSKYLLLVVMPPSDLTVAGIFPGRGEVLLGHEQGLAAGADPHLAALDLGHLALPDLVLHPLVLVLARLLPRHRLAQCDSVEINLQVVDHGNKSVGWCKKVLPELRIVERRPCWSPLVCWLPIAWGCYTAPGHSELHHLTESGRDNSTIYPGRSGAGDRETTYHMQYSAVCCSTSTRADNEPSNLRED